MDYQLTSRRRVLTAVGTGATVALAGCSSNGQESSQSEGSNGDGTEQNDGSNSDQSESGTDDGSDEPDETGNTPGEYPTQETTGLMAEADQLIDENVTFGGEYSSFAFRIDDYDFLDIEEFPNILDGRDESSLLELAENHVDLSYQEALYVASKIKIPSGTESSNMYFAVPDARDTRKNTVIYVNLQKQEASEVAKAVGAFAPNKIIDDPQSRMQLQAEFFRNHIDPDGIVHAVDLAEHNYAVEALHSGFGSE